MFQNQKQSNKKFHSIVPAFTLVELIVVIVMLAILATIAFLSFNSYSSSARDSNRLSDITNIAKGLTLQYSIGGKYLIPENYSTLTLSGVNIGYQGYAGANILGTIKISNNGGKDPLDNIYYTYSTNNNQNKYQLLGFLENKSSAIYSYGENNLLEQTHSKTYSNRYPYEKGDTLGIILTQSGTNTTNLSLNNYTPIQDTSTGIELNNINTGVVAYIDNNSTTNSGIVYYLTGIVGNYLNNENSTSDTIQVDNETKLLLHLDGNLINAGSNNGIITNNGSVTFAGGKFSQAALFNGSNYLGIPYSTDWILGDGDFTIEAWINYNQITDGMAIISASDYNGGTSNGFNIHSIGHTTYYTIRAVAGNTIVDGTIHLLTGQWYHVAFTRNGTIERLYINGNFDTSGTATNIGSSGNTSLTIGGWYYIGNSTWYYTNGYIDEIRISKGIARRTTPSFTLPSTPY